MRGKQHRRHQHRRGRQQFDLFMEADNAPRQRPDWDMLPVQTRQALTDPMARLILDHKDNERHPLPRETRHDL